MKKKILFQSISKALAVLLLTGGSYAFAQHGPERRERPAHTPSQRPQQPASIPHDNRPHNMQRPLMRPAAPANRPIVQRPQTNNRPGQRPPMYSQAPGSRPGFSRPQNVHRPPMVRNQVAINRNYANRPTPNINRGAGYRPVNRGYSRLNYTRPPVVYGGRRFYTHYNYAYHPYRPRYYGSYYHPVGFFTAALGLGALTFMLDNHPYSYYEGVYYQPYNNGYRVIPAPEGATVTGLPDGYTTVPLGNETFYYFAGIFYERTAEGYTVIDAPAGAIVYDLPEGCTEWKVGNITYLRFNDTVFQPIVIDGENAYEVVDLEEDDNNGQ